MTLPTLALVLGTLVVVVPTRDGLVIVADSKSTRRTTGGAAAGVTAAEKVFTLPGQPGHAFFVTGASPVEWIVEGHGVATVVDARGVVHARLSRRGATSRADFDAVADECAKLAARIHRMGPRAAPLVGRDLFSVVMVRAGSGNTQEVASFVITLTATSASVSKREWVRFAPGDAAKVLMFGEGAFVGAGIRQWTGGAADCARQFLGAGRRLVREMDAETAARGAHAIQEATSTAMGDAGTVGPPFRAYVLTLTLRELPPVAPCR